MCDGGVDLVAVLSKSLHSLPASQAAYLHGVIPSLQLTEYGAAFCRANPPLADL